MWRTCLQWHRDLGGELGISLFISLLFDLVALSFPCLISYIFEVYCDEIWLYLSYKGFWSSLGSSLWRKIVGSGCQSSGWPRSLLNLVLKKNKNVVTAWALPPHFAGVTQELEFPSSIENDPASLSTHILSCSCWLYVPSLQRHWGIVVFLPVERAGQSSFKNLAVNPLVNKSWANINT